MILARLAILIGLLSLVVGCTLLCISLMTGAYTTVGLLVAFGIPIVLGFIVTVAGITSLNSERHESIGASMLGIRDTGQLDFMMGFEEDRDGLAAVVISDLSAIDWFFESTSLSGSKRLTLLYLASDRPDQQFQWPGRLGFCLRVNVLGEARAFTVTPSSVFGRLRDVVKVRDIEGARVICKELEMGSVGVSGTPPDHRFQVHVCDTERMEEV